MIYHLFRLPSDLQFFGKDCQALAATCKALANAVGTGVSIVTTENSKKRNEKLTIWSLDKNVFKKIIRFLSDGLGQFLENIQSAPSCGKSFEPR
jgi:hypothetical protein